ncbi:MAG TPA: oligosaccharide flippase family protein [Longimicrobiaceae bacterium]|nr:oligosaccharide flippase family protein [Longimicrobiaceae bacterium]
MVAPATPPTEDATLSFARSAVRAVAALGVRQVLVQGANVLGGVLLARLLSPGEFGVFGIVTFILAFLVAFGGAGLGASLIRQTQEPTTADYRAVFSVQQAMVVGVGVLLWLAAPWIAAQYGRPPVEAWLFRLLAIAVFLTSYQTIAAIRLERELAFHRLAAVEVSQALVFNGLAVGLAWAGWGAMSFAVALVARAAVGAVWMNLISPWPIGWTWDPSRVREHLRFGILYQGGSFVSLLKDSITPLFVGFLLGAKAVGYINWAGMVAAYPVLALMVFQRFYLPAFARMQDRPAELCRFVGWVLRATNSLVAPLAVVTLVLVEPLTRIVFGEKWLVALPLFYLLWSANLFVPTATPLAGLLNALGDARTPFRFSLLWMTGTWLAGVPLILSFGVVGFAVANLIVQFSNLLLMRIARARVPFAYRGVFLPAWGAAAAAGLVVFLLARVYPPASLWGLAADVGVGGLLYIAGLCALDLRAAGTAWSWLRSCVWSPASQS